MLSVEQLIQNLMNTTQPSVVRCSAIVNLVSQGSSQGIEALIEVLRRFRFHDPTRSRDGTSAHGRDSGYATVA